MGVSDRSSILRLHSMAKPLTMWGYAGKGYLYFRTANSFGATHLSIQCQ